MRDHEEATDTEEDFRARVVQYLAGVGVSAQQLRFEHVVRLRVGRQIIQVKGERATSTLRGRYDLLFVNDEGRNVLLAELKRTTAPITTDDRDQAISYARLQDQMPPLVLVTNGDSTHLYDVVTRDDLASAEIAPGWPVWCAGRLTATADDLRLREEALQLFVGYSQQNVRAFCIAQQSERMDALRGDGANRTRKYLPSVYVPSSVVREAFRAFLESQDPAFVLAGPSGVGKTNEMCALAEAARDTHFALFFGASELADPPARVLADEFNWAFSDELSLRKICDRLANFVSGSERRVLVFLDAIDECSVALVERSLSDLVLHFGRYAGSLKLVASLKDAQWDRFASFGDGYSALARKCFHAPAAPGVATRVVEGQPSLVMEWMAEGDFAEAIRRYRSHFGIPGEIPMRLFETARDPFALRVFAELCADGATDPGALGRDQVPLLKRYLDQKFAKLPSSTRTGPRVALENVGRALLDAAKTAGVADVHAVSESAALGHSPVAAGWLELPREPFDSGLLIRERDDAGRARVRFQHERVRDYVVAYHVLQLDCWTDVELDRQFDSLMLNPVGRAALTTFLDAVGSDPGTILRLVAHRRAISFLAAYEECRSDLGVTLRSHISPFTAQGIGLIYFVRDHRQWTYGLFARQDAEPAVLQRPNYDSEWRELLRGRGDRSVPVTATLHRSGAWPLLRDPVKLACEVALTEIQRAIADGGLDESASDALERELILAIANRNRRELGLAGAPWQLAEAAAEMGADLLPIDLELLRRRVHGAFGARQANVDALRGGGHRAVTEAMDRARTEAMSGRRFEGSANVKPVPQLTVLGRVVDRRQARESVMKGHYLPLPDRPRSAAMDDRYFEDGYSDEQLSRLIARLWILRLDEYVRLIEANLPRLSPCLRQRASLPQRVVAWFERGTGDRRLGCDGDLSYVTLDAEEPQPTLPGAAAALDSSGSGSIQVLPSSEVRCTLRDGDGRLVLSTPDGKPFLMSQGWGQMSLERFLHGRDDIPCGWRAEIVSGGFMPVRGGIYALLIDDLVKLDATALLRSGVES